MATVVLQYAGQALGSFLGGPLGGVLGRAVGAIAGNLIDQSLFGGGIRRVEGPRLSDLRVMGSGEGTPIPRRWGRMRVAGQVIWSTNFEEVVATHTEKASGKGGSGSGGTKIVEYNYFANFAVALCEGEIARIGRAWADGKPFDLSNLTWRLYTGSETQSPDSLIVAKEGAGNAPAYRGLAYMVFERMPVNAFGNRLPQLSFEAMRPAGGAEAQVRAVNVIPGATEFGYETTIETRKLGNGVTEPENATAMASRSDFAASLDDLTATCANLEAAALVVAWFGTDLRCGSCDVRPGVENLIKVTTPDTWQVAGLERGAAHVVSNNGGGPAFGGTPSDKSVIHALQDMRARGLKAVFYPFVMMDVASGNGLPDPYGGSEQAAYPWRGRITCHPAPGRPASPDKTAACATQVASFVGAAQPSQFTASGTTVIYSGPAEWSYRRMVLHYAKLCAAAGGVDAFLIGSELRGLTTLRGTANSFPFVQALATLAAEVKAILPAAKISYAADWTEYFGYQPADGSADVYFHLDPLWASSSVDFVGIDNYMPLADWRDGDQHTDYLAGATSPYDLAYLTANIAGGEGYDWHYADDAARAAQTRAAITDGAYGKPWVFRYKDFKSWWLNQHRDRPGGVEQATATAWVPQSKPFWFTELGCPAVDKGANQPNKFIDAKSSESGLPYFSAGSRDDLIQNRFIIAHGQYWRFGPAVNPISSVYGGPMLDTGRIFLWAWDARPFPYFPARDDLWADTVNYPLGHWLNGRVGAVPLAELILGVCAGYGFDAVDAAAVEGLVDGFLIDRPMAARDALEGLLQAFAIDPVERDGKLVFRMRRANPLLTLTPDRMVETDPAAALYTLTRAQETELPRAVKLAYIETALDYRSAAVESVKPGIASAREVRLDLACAVSQSAAQMRTDVALQESWVGREMADLTLPPSLVALEPGDVLTLDLGTAFRTIRIDSITDGEARKLQGRSYDAAVYDAPAAADRAAQVNITYSFGEPDALFLDLPVAGGTRAAFAPWLAASANPWPGQLAVYRGSALNRTIDAQATKGTLLDALAAGFLHVFDRSTAVSVKLDNGALSSVTETELLQGANIAAIGDQVLGWEIVQFTSTELVGPDTYRISHILRGQSGSNPEMPALRPAGARFVLLNGAVVQPVMTLADAGLTQTWKIGPAQYDVQRDYVSLTEQSRMLGLRPFSPCQLRVKSAAAGLAVSWIRRTRIDGDSWDVVEVPLGEDSEAYALDILSGTTLKRSVTVSSPAFTYAAADRLADFGAGAAAITFRVAQLSATYGRGAALERTFNV